MTRPLILAIDGGGTATTAWLADAEGRVLGRARAGPSNPVAVGWEAACAALERAVASAFADAAAEPGTLAAACLGLAGSDRAGDKERLRTWAESTRLARRLVLVNDADLVLAAGTEHGWGVAVIAGTGSIAVGRSRQGQTARAGGWGHLFGDEGSAYAVVLSALRLVARRADGREAIGLEKRGQSLGPNQTGPLGSKLMAALGVSQASELVSAVYSVPLDRARIASLAPIVLEAADQDHVVRDAILKPAGRALGECVLAVARAIDWQESALPLALAGGFLLVAQPLSEALQSAVEETGRFSVVVSRVDEPVTGGLLLARRALHG